ncbi:MAG: Panacea domain-containing protein [Burkholderiales bacterium]
MLKNLFKEKKAAQAAAYLLFRAGKPLSVLKLMKLLYLAERRSFEKFGEPMIGDVLVSMDHGPVLSRTYNHMKGMTRSSEKGWEYWIADRAGHDLDLRHRKALRSPEKDLQQLSDADLGVLEEIWKKFGRMNQWKLRDYTHRHCPEWQDPEGSMIPMKPENFLTALKFTSRQAKQVLARLRAEDRLNAAFESVKG